MSGNTIGLAMITLNEEIHIPVAITQFCRLASDVVVVDGGSTDGTVYWCEKLGARVIHHPFEDDFAAQRNRAIVALETDWVYVHDPDERLEPQLLEIFPYLADPFEGQKSLMRDGILPTNCDSFDCFGFPRRNFLDGLQTEAFPDYQYRFFRNYCRFERPVHEEITGFKNRTELDYSRNTLENPPRYNILHYKNSQKQAAQASFYERIEKKIAP